MRSCIDFTPALVATYSFMCYRYVRDRTDRHLRECVEQSGQVDVEIAQQEQNLANIRSRLAEIEKEIHTGEATQANLRENVRVRKLAADIAKIESEIRELDVGGAAQAFTEFEEKYAKLIKKASELQNKVFIESILSRSPLTILIVHVSWWRSHNS